MTLAAYAFPYRPTTRRTSAPATAKVTKPKKAVAAKPKKSSSHPTYSVMLQNAVKDLNEQGGSSVHAMKKYIVTNFQVDPDRISPHMKRGLKAALTAGTLSQVKGKGMTGSYKLGKAAKIPNEEKTVSLEKAVKMKTAYSPKKPNVAAKKPVAKPKVTKSKRDEKSKAAVNKSASPKGTWAKAPKTRSRS